MTRNALDSEPAVAGSLPRRSARRSGPGSARPSDRAGTPLPRFALLLGLLLAVAGCGDRSSAPSEGSGEDGAEWISGSVDERFQALGDQLGGFSQSMLEVGHRYEDLHWAIEDGNWAYGTYQIQKIGDAIERGIVRRPGRAESARTHFLNGPLGAMEAALASGEDVRIRTAFDELTAACNQCHVVEGMAFVVVGPPHARRTSVQPSGAER